MEEARYWMWAKRSKPDSNHNILAPTTSSAMINSSYIESSWEEQAFAEDAAAGALIGGCVWPPRSYSCSFCRREFRSAQALGGHMNVHRRDRARLKQSPMNIIPSPTTDVINSYPRTVTTSFDAAAPPPYSNSFSYNNNNPNPDFATPRAAVRVSSSAKAVANGEGKIVTSSNDGPCLNFSSLFGENDKEKRVSSLIIPPSWSSFIAEKRDRVSDSIFEIKSTAGVEQEESRAERLEDCVTDDLSTSLNLVVRQTNITSSDEEVASFKRRRVEITKQPSVSFFAELSAADRSEVFKTGSGSVEELDLELRLGN